MRRNEIISGIGRAIFLVIVVVIVICAGLASCAESWRKGTERREEIGTVTDKGTKRSGDDDKYLVYTKDENGESQVFEITDSFAFGRYNSADVYAGIEIGKTYSFTVVGKRSEFYSIYPNIKEYHEVAQPTSVVTESAITEVPAT